MPLFKDQRTVLIGGFIKCAGRRWHHPVLEQLRASKPGMLYVRASPCAVGPRHLAVNDLDGKQLCHIPDPLPEGGQGQ